MAYPPKDLPASVQLWDLHGLPVSVGRVPGCPWRIASWGDGQPKPYSRQQDAAFARSLDFTGRGGKRVSEAEFRQLITIRQAGY
ncbi:MAG: hypothetical protein AB1430_17350 [Pseudomonadota bacterium]